ncbi:MAG: hypothetical protein AAF846_08870 [Chloroflexota bacterium]
MRNFMSNTRFMLLWGLGSIASLFSAIVVGFLLFVVIGLIVSAIMGEGLANLTPVFAMLIVGIWFGGVGMVMGWTVGGIQKAILRMHTREPWRGWLVSSAIGGFVGVIGTFAILASQIAGHFLMQVLPTPDTILWWFFQFILIFFGSLGLCQMFALRQYSRGAWVWILANLVAGVVLYSLVAFGWLSFITTPPLAIVAGFLVAAAPGIVTGFVLVWLMNSNWRS